MGKTLRTTDESLALIRQWVNFYGTYMGILQQWHVELSAVPASKLEDTDSDAECSWPTGYHNARIKFNLKTLNTVSEAELETTVVHELCHLVFFNSFDTIQEQFGAKSKMTSILLNEEEKNVDILARFIIRSQHERSSDRFRQLYGYPESVSIEPDDSERIEESAGRNIVWDGGSPADFGLPSGWFRD